MRIVIDMQGAQTTGSRNRGIGRYTLAFAQAVARNRGEHEIILALSGLFPDTIEPIRAAFEGLLPQENIRVWHAVSPVAQIHPANYWRRHTAELAREAFLASLQPDIVHVCSLFEGLVDDAVTSIGRLPKEYLTSVTLHDLIPYIYRKPYLENPAVETWYLEKIEHLRRADLWLAISESSRQEGIGYLGLPEDRIVNVSEDADPQFQKITVTKKQEHLLRERYGLSRPFVMYTASDGGINDSRKNIEGLIQAYAKLPQELRAAYQLAIVCSCPAPERDGLLTLASKSGLGGEEIRLTGFVPEEDLIALYNLCTLFVFPSWHEGLDLPVLEAMRCSAPAIGANANGLAEVIGLEEALFPPRDDEAMAKATERALTDEAYRARLKEHGARQAQKFSWNTTAKRALAAMENAVAARKPAPRCRPRIRPRLAYLSPLPPERSGIADYSAELIPALSKHYAIDVVAQEQVKDPWIEANCTIRTVEWFRANAHRYDRILYHFGNSHFHRHLFDLLREQPGVVVLHDFYLSHLIHWMDATGYKPGIFSQALYHSHGYAALAELSQVQDVTEVIWKYPCNLDVLQNALGVIVHSSYSRQLAQQWYRATDAHDWAVIPLLRVAADSVERHKARQALGLSSDDFVVCSFGILGPSKLNHRLLQAWMNSPLAADPKCHLVFVGEADGAYGEQLRSAIRSDPRILITGWASTSTFRHYLAAADIAAQLRNLSRGETSAAVLDCMNHGLATIVNAHGSLAELDSEAVWLLPDDFSDEQLIDALTQLWQDPKKRQSLGERAKRKIRTDHDPAKCAAMYYRAIERFYEHAHGRSVKPVVRAIAALPARQPEDAELARLASALAQNMPPRPRQRQLLVDVSAIAVHDLKTGIQRVVRSVLKEWLLNPPEGLRVEPVYATPQQPYRYARRFTQRFLGLNNELPDDPIDHRHGDIFFALDLYLHVQTAQRAFYQILRRAGVRVQFLVHDLLPMQMPQVFPPGTADEFASWLQVVAESDGAVCVSKATAQALQQWIKNQKPSHTHSFTVTWSHHGADVENSAPTLGSPPDADKTLAILRTRLTFLMVGTIEPRKAYLQTLEAFEQLWQEGIDVNLVIVGYEGWKHLPDDMRRDIPKTIKKLNSHPERNKRLFWLEGISDEYLKKIYAASTCLIAASYGEGFGLPLIEAARHKLPIIARDIPVFREVAKEYAYYFNTTSPEGLAQSVKTWLDYYRLGTHPKSESMPWLTWRDSARNLIQIIQRLN